MEEKQYKYDAFISYRHCDLDKFVAENLHKILETYELPNNIKESLKSLATHNATMCIFLGVGMIDEVVEELSKEYPKETPVAVVKKASWPDEEIIEGTLENISQKVKKANITKTAMIIVSNVLRNDTFKESKLYDSKFTHEYRKAKK